MNRRIYIGIPLLIVVIALAIFANNATKIEPGLNEDYINSEILFDEIYSIDEILLTSETEHYVSCLCSLDNNTLLLLILDNNKDYSLEQKLTISTNLLKKDSQKRQVFKPFSSGEELYYNLYTNPNSDTVKINGKELRVQKAKAGKINVGFWCYEP